MNGEGRGEEAGGRGRQKPIQRKNVGRKTDQK